jgi:Predicted acetyltransferase
MSKHYLQKINLDMGKDEYNMYRAIPAEEIGYENPAHHMNYNEWREYLKENIKQENSIDNPRITYIMYLEKYPIGIASLRPKDASNGNISYCIRPVCRGSGLGTKILDLLIHEAQKLNMTSLLGQCNKNNLVSQKTMIKNGMVLYKQDDFSKFYRLK